MGKKSKRRTAKTSGKAPFELSSAIVSASTLCQSSFANPFENEPTPETGWARELRLAEKQLKDDKYRSHEVILRAATAACAMRQFERLGEIITKTESKGVAIDDADHLALVERWENQCSAYKKRYTRLNNPEERAYLKKAVDKNLSLDSTIVDHATFSGLTALQHAAYLGDVPYLERLVSQGAALDYSNDDDDRRDRSKITKPPGCTALLMAVVGALCCSHPKYESLANIQQCRVGYERTIECAVALVRMGANVNVRLHIPVGPDASSDFYELMQKKKWIGKSVRELATETGSGFLVQTIETFSSTDDKIKLAYCRCGSRLPWEMCHSGTKDSGCHYDLRGDPEDRERKVMWRFSPCAPCPCKNNKKPYFKCCWDEPFREYFLCDETRQLGVYSTKTVNDRINELNSSQYMDPNALLKLHCAQIRAGGQHKMEKMSEDFHPKSKLGTWDPNVYAGVMEHLNVNVFFQWNDAHWAIPKPELLKRVAEWNEALEKYCDHVGLVGLEREEVVKLHTASELAPCANMNCNKMEIKVKEFSRCSKCLSIAYCSSACLKENHPFHEEECMGRLPKQQQISECVGHK